VTNENFRRELGQTFDDMTGSPSAALRDRVRSSLADASERRGPFWIAGLAAALIAAIVVGLLVVSNMNRHQTSLVPGGGPSASPSALTSANPSVSPTASPNASPSPTTGLPAFTCSSSGANIDFATPPAVGLVDAVRAGTHPGYDRLTLEFQSGHPTGLGAQEQGSATFTQGASGQKVTLDGSASILVTIQHADEHTAYSGPIDFKTGYSVLLEARQVQDFEGTVQWGLGLSKSACYRTFFLENPTRLVIDIQTS
jgi:hypothetical protein